MVQKVLTVTDFDRILDNYAGRQISHVVVTRSISNISGSEELVESAPVLIKAYFMRTAQNWNFQEAGFVEKGDATALIKIADGIKKDDLLIVDGSKYRVKEAYDVPGVFDSTGSASELVYTATNLFLVE